MQSTINTTVRSVVRSVVTTGSTPTPPPSPTQRYFILQDDPARSHYAFSSDITLAADFEISFEFQTTTTFTTYVAFGASNNYIRMASGKFRFRINNGSSSTTLASPLAYNDGKLHTCSCKIESGVMTLSVDGSVVATNGSPVTHLDWVLPVFGALTFNSGIWRGMLANISIDNITEDEQYSYVLGNETSNTEVDNGITLTYTNIPATQAFREEYELSGDETQWDNISPPTQQLPAVIEIA